MGFMKNTFPSLLLLAAIIAFPASLSAQEKSSWYIGFGLGTGGSEWTVDGGSLTLFRTLHLNSRRRCHAIHVPSTTSGGVVLLLTFCFPVISLCPSDGSVTLCSVLRLCS